MEPRQYQSHATADLQIWQMRSRNTRVAANERAPAPHVLSSLMGLIPLLASPPAINRCAIFGPSLRDLAVGWGSPELLGLANAIKLDRAPGSRDERRSCPLRIKRRNEAKLRRCRGGDGRAFDAHLRAGFRRSRHNR